MSRSERLFDLLHALRRHRRPVSGKILADEIGVSIRTIYRDIASLQAQGAEIEGEPGLGYVLKPGFMLPPLMFPSEEIEALMLGMHWVASRTDGSLADSALSALARIAAVLPPGLRHELEASALFVGSGWRIPNDRIAPELLRKAIRAERKLRLAYRDISGAISDRIVWPFALTYFDQSRVLVCWCEQREDFRHFRTDRIDDAELLDSRYPRHRQALLKEWKRTANIAPETGHCQKLAVHDLTLDSRPTDRSMTMKFSVRLVTKDLDKLVAFYMMMTGVAPSLLKEDYAEIHIDGTTLAICTESLVKEFNAGAAVAAANRSAILEFLVDDVDAIHTRLTAEPIELVMPPTDRPWGYRGMMLRDPDGNLINIFAPLKNNT